MHHSLRASIRADEAQMAVTHQLDMWALYGFNLSEIGIDRERMRNPKVFFETFANPSPAFQKYLALFNEECARDGITCRLIENKLEATLCTVRRFFGLPSKETRLKQSFAIAAPVQATSLAANY